MTARRKPSAELLVYAPSQWGTESFAVDLKHLAEFQRDPDAFIAALYGVSKENYLRWLDDNYSVQCSGTTKGKKRCRSIIVGGSNVGPQQYVAMQGQYCEKHGGLSRADI